MGPLQDTDSQPLYVRFGDSSGRGNHGCAGANCEPSDFERLEELTMPLGQKVIVIGGGHNGLIAAFYLARGGFKPVVLERREVVGGGAVTEEFHPGFHASALAHTLGPLRSDVARDLAVERYDCQIFQPDPRMFSPSPDGRALLFYSDVAKTAGGIARISARDAERYPS